MAGSFYRPSPSDYMSTGRALLVLGTIAVLVFTAGILVVALLS